jgi:hypothetical protein
MSSLVLEGHGEADNFNYEWTEVRSSTKYVRKTSIEASYRKMEVNWKR